MRRRVRRLRLAFGSRRCGKVVVRGLPAQSPFLRFGHSARGFEFDQSLVMALNAMVTILADWPTAMRAALIAVAVAGKLAPSITAMRGFLIMSAART